MDRAPWLAIDWRKQQSWLACKHGPLNVIEAGSGPPLLFVHGLGGNWTNWLEQLPIFAAAHRVIAFDLPGFGASPVGNFTIGISGYLALLRELLDQLELPQVAVIGNSMGGLLAAELTIAEPRRVRALALISPAGFPLPISRARAGLLRALSPLITASGRQVARHADALARRPRLRWALIGTVAADPLAMSVPLATEQLRGMGKEGLRSAFDSLYAHHIDERALSTIACPSLIVWGTRDKLLPVRQAELYGRAIPRARKVIYERTGHVPMLERPAEVNALLAELLVAADWR